MVPLCPIDPSHGRLLDWATDKWGYHCTHQDHEGWKERPPTRAYFTTAETEEANA